MNTVNHDPGDEHQDVLRAIFAQHECECDFCTGRKLYADNWCARCGEVKLQPPKHWENLDVCDVCEAQISEEAGLRKEHVP